MNNDSKEYWSIYIAVTDMLNSHDLLGTDAFIDECVRRVQEDADAEWNEDDVRIAIRNVLNELIEKM